MENGNGNERLGSPGINLGRYLIWVLRCAEECVIQLQARFSSGRWQLIRPQLCGLEGFRTCQTGWRIVTDRCRSLMTMTSQIVRNFRGCQALVVRIIC